MVVSWGGEAGEPRSTGWWSGEGERKSVVEEMGFWRGENKAPVEGIGFRREGNKTLVEREVFRWGKEQNPGRKGSFPEGR